MAANHTIPTLPSQTVVPARPICPGVTIPAWPVGSCPSRTVIFVPRRQG